MRVRRISVSFLFLLLSLVVPGLSTAMEAGALPLRPGETRPPPRQRGLNEVEKLPEETVACPVCEYDVVVPLVDMLMRRRPIDPDPLPWQMDAGAGRDADLCPYPAPNKVAFQADVVLCPACGYANRRERFADPLPAEARDWVFAALRPVLRDAETALLGKRASDMSEEEITGFFNRQEALPDTIRTEHRRTFLLASHAPGLERAEACLQAAWASRREVASLPKGDFLARRATAIQASLAAAKQSREGVHGQLDVLRLLIRRQRQGRDGLPGGENMAARVLLAGLHARLGFLTEAEETLQTLHHELRERFLRPEQDPLWSATPARDSRTNRLKELEIIRSEAEQEVFVRAELVRRERDQMLAAAECIRDAFRGGELDDKPELARFHAYMMGECLRRAGDLPLASEWFKNLISLAPAESTLAKAAGLQLAYVGEEAGDKVNLLSALGRDGELFARLRRICRADAEISR